jgi:hypothetical protein
MTSRTPAKTLLTITAWPEAAATPTVVARTRLSASRSSPLYSTTPLSERPMRLLWIWTEAPSTATPST